MITWLIRNPNRVFVICNNKICSKPRRKRPTEGALWLEFRTWPSVRFWSKARSVQMNLRVKQVAGEKPRKPYCRQHCFQKQSFRNSQVWSGQAGHHLNIAHAAFFHQTKGILWLCISKFLTRMKQSRMLCSSCREMQISVSKCASISSMKMFQEGNYW